MTDIVWELKRISRIVQVFIIAIVAVGFGLATVFFCINYFNDESVWAAVTGDVSVMWLVITMRRG